MPSELERLFLECYRDPQAIRLFLDCLRDMGHEDIADSVRGRGAVAAIDPLFRRLWMALVFERCVEREILDPHLLQREL